MAARTVGGAGGGLAVRTISEYCAGPKEFCRCRLTAKCVGGGSEPAQEDDYFLAPLEEARAASSSFRHFVASSLRSVAS